MITLEVPCPACGGDIIIPASEFKPVPDLHEETVLEARCKCPNCSLGAALAQVYLVDAEEDDSDDLTVDHIRVEPLLVENT